MTLVDPEEVRARLRSERAAQFCSSGAMSGAQIPKRDEWQVTAAEADLEWGHLGAAHLNPSTYGVALHSTTDLRMATADWLWP